MTEAQVRGGGAPPSPPSLLGGYARGVAWTYLAVVLTGASTFFLAAWSVRRVGTAQFGVFALVSALTGLLIMFGTGGWTGLAEVVAGYCRDIVGTSAATAVAP